MWIFYITRFFSFLKIAFTTRFNVLLFDNVEHYRAVRYAKSPRPKRYPGYSVAFFFHETQNPNPSAAPVPSNYQRTFFFFHFFSHRDDQR